MKRAALISVSNRDGIVAFARQLHDAGYVILSTSGTGKLLKAEGITVTSIAEYTGQAEILGGRVKTLHPKIHAGILARRDVAEDMRELEREQIYPIDIVAVNLYPFSEQLAAASDRLPAEMLEFIDIGGPTMIRAAAKNFPSVIPVIDPQDYTRIAAHLSNEQSATDGGPAGVPVALRAELAAKVFAALAQYNLDIAQYTSCVAEASDGGSGAGMRYEPQRFSRYDGMVLSRAQELRYGENPHQPAAYYRRLSCEKSQWRQHGGKALSYNNMLDADAAIRVLADVEADASMNASTAVVVKHLTACGAAVRTDPAGALLAAKASDPRSHFGGIFGLNCTCTKEAAEVVVSDFAEIILAPGFEEGAMQILAKKKNLRIVEYAAACLSTVEMRSSLGGVLLQGRDMLRSDVHGGRLMTSRAISTSEYNDLQFAWILCAHLKSNAVCIVRDKQLLGGGAGQTSRVDAAQLCIEKARSHGHQVDGAVAASDAFFPFPDSVQKLAEAGVVAVVAPGGARADEEVVEAAERAGISLLFMADRHFRH